MTASRAKVLISAGTRAEAIKVAPLIKAFQQMVESSVDIHFCTTGQHQELLDSALDSFGITPNSRLRLSRTSGLGGLLGQMIPALECVIQSVQPDIVIVEGDTASTLASAIAGFLGGVSVCHLEAGLRSGSRREPYPEEIFRLLISDLATFHLAPYESAKEALLRENIPPDKIFVTGNTIEDAIALEMGQQPNTGVLRLDPNKQEEKKMLVTIHRRENIGPRTRQICAAINSLVDKIPGLHALVIVHPNPQLHSDMLHLLGSNSRVSLLEPLTHLEFISLLRLTDLVLSDSGGVSEEAALLGIPMFICREVTERTNLIDSGAAQLVGTTSENIVRIVSRFLDGSITLHPMPLSLEGREPLAVSKRVVNIITDQILPLVRG